MMNINKQDKWDKLQRKEWLNRTTYYRAMGNRIRLRLKEG